MSAHEPGQLVRVGANGHGRPAFPPKSGPQARALRKAVESMAVLLGDSDVRVLLVIVEHANSAGWLWLKVQTIADKAELDRATVFRSLKRLCSADSPLLELRHRRRGDGRQAPSDYRLGRSLRAAAKLDDSLAARHPNEVSAERKTSPMADAATLVATLADCDSARATLEPAEEPCKSNGSQPESQPNRATPRTLNPKNGYEETLTSNRSEGSRARDELLGEIPWPYTTGLSREQSLFAELDALTTFGGRWIEVDE